MRTASLGRRRPHSPAAGPLDDDDLLCEILIRLPPQPSSLPRASAVCKRWRRLVSDPTFFRRFRLHHRRNPPLLGFFQGTGIGSQGMTFVPTLEAPNRVHPGRFSPPSGLGDCFQCLGCRHGLVLFFLQNSLRVLVWDPVTGDQHRLAIPPGVATYAKNALINGAVLRAAGDVQHFQVVLTVAYGDEQHRRALACLYSSQTGLWGDLVSIPLPCEASNWELSVNTDDAVLDGDYLYWVLEEFSFSYRILEFDLLKQSLAVIEVPSDMCSEDIRFGIMRAEGGGLGVLLVSDSDCTAQLWKRKTDWGGVASWSLARTIELGKLLSLKSDEKGPLYIPGFAEENNTVFMWTSAGLFMIHLESLKCNKIFEGQPGTFYQPFEGVYAAGI
ncbi:F-box/kelch-repeat protein At3g23880 [Lolium perenne]|uniref:F-box/kelch-repeat protein At3g23880 n=1 Tax=Lolium perenne TaxID=4522 RepID=UPI0021F5D772|nr:uncharacterized protein LOC127308727 [Lolium perenne]